MGHWHQLFSELEVVELREICEKGAFLVYRKWSIKRRGAYHNSHGKRSSVYFKDRQDTINLIILNELGSADGQHFIDDTLYYENLTNNRNQIYSMSMSSSSSPSLSVVWCGSLASSTSDSVILNV